MWNMKIERLHRLEPESELIIQIVSFVTQYRDYPFDAITAIVEDLDQFNHPYPSKIIITIRTDDDLLVGVGIGVANFACDYLMNVAWITTHHDYRGRGYAKEVIAEISSYWADTCRFPGHASILLDCDIELEGFYSKLGFHTIHRFSASDGKEILMMGPANAKH